MPQIPASLQAPPGQPGGPSPASGAPPGMAKPPGQGGGMNPIQLLLSFLAGAGLDKVVAALSKVMQPPGGAGGAGRKHQGGVRMEASQNPGMTVAPQMAQQMAQGMGGGADGALNSQALPLLLALLASKGGGSQTPPGSMGGMQ